MNPIDILIVAIILVILGSVSFFLHRAKKKGVHCIGCPDSGKCSGHCSGCSGNCGSCGMKK